MIPFKSSSPWFLILCYLPEWSTTGLFCLVIVVHESLVCPEQLNCLLFFRKILHVPTNSLVFQHFLYLNPFQQWLYDFEIHLFTLRTTEGLICNYYRRIKHSLMLQKEKPCIKRVKGWKLFEFEDQGIELILSSGKHVTIICSFWRAVLNEKEKLYLGKIRNMYTSPFCSKVFTPRLYIIYLIMIILIYVCVYVCV